jgi:hypothetical protein
MNMALYKPLRAIVDVTSDFWLINSYGPFAVMTRERPEIIIQGSLDGEHWQDYRFSYKPLELDKPPAWNIPHQPRLDWQLWFAALSEPDQNRWFLQFMQRLKANEPSVTNLLKENPFSLQAPKFLRALLYRYSFTDFDERKTSGRIWKREFLKIYWQNDR